MNKINVYVDNDYIILLGRDNNNNVHILHGYFHEFAGDVITATRILYNRMQQILNNANNKHKQEPRILDITQIDLDELFGNK